MSLNRKDATAMCGQESKRTTDKALYVDSVMLLFLLSIRATLANSGLLEAHIHRRGQLMLSSKGVHLTCDV